MSTLFWQRIMLLLLSYMFPLVVQASSTAVSYKKVSLEDFVMTLVGIPSYYKQLPKDLQYHMCLYLQETFLGRYESKSPVRCLTHNQSGLIQPKGVRQLQFSHDNARLFFVQDKDCIILDMINPNFKPQFPKSIKLFYGQQVSFSLSPDSSKCIIWYGHMREAGVIEVTLQDETQESRPLNAVLNALYGNEGQPRESYVRVDECVYRTTNTIGSLVYSSHDHVIVRTNEHKVVELDLDGNCKACSRDPLVTDIASTVHPTQNKILFWGSGLDRKVAELPTMWRVCDTIQEGVFRTLATLKQIGEEFGRGFVGTSSDGNYLLFICHAKIDSDGDRIKIWDVQNQNVYVLLERPERVHDVALSNDNKFLLVRLYDRVLVYHALSGNQFAVFDMGSRTIKPYEHTSNMPAKVIMSDDDSLVATAASENEIFGLRNIPQAHKNEYLYLGVFRCDPHWKEFDELFCGHIEIEQVCFIILLRCIAYYNQEWRKLLARIEKKEDCTSDISKYTQQYAPNEDKDTPLSRFFRARYIQAIEDTIAHPPESYDHLKGIFSYPVVIAALEKEWGYAQDELRRYFKARFLQWKSDDRIPFHTYCLHVLGIPV